MKVDQNARALSYSISSGGKFLLLAKYESLELIIKCLHLIKHSPRLHLSVPSTTETITTAVGK